MAAPVTPVRSGACAWLGAPADIRIRRPTPNRRARSFIGNSGRCMSESQGRADHDDEIVAVVILDVRVDGAVLELLDERPARYDGNFVGGAEPPFLFAPGFTWIDGGIRSAVG